MENLLITGNSNTYLVPYINFNAHTGYCEIIGESYLEETKEFYDKLMSWFLAYIKEVGGSLKIDIKLSYFNTGTSRCLLEIFRLLKGYQLQGGEVSITWHISHEEDYMMEEIEDFVINSGLMINQILF